MAEVTIGAQAYSVTLPNFKKLKQAWRYIAAIQSSEDPMDGVDAILGVICVGSATAVTVDDLEEAMTPQEMQGLRPFIDALLIETGLAKKPEGADPLAVAEASPSMETLTA
jgi:hypothetical protein